MISLIYNNESFELLPNTKIEIERGNPYLGNTEIEGDLSYPLTIPLFPKNVRMLQFRSEFGAAYPGKYDITLIDSNGVEEKGIMLLENQDSNFVFPNQGTITINLKFGISAFAEMVNNKNLRQFKYGGKRYIPKADLWNNITNRWTQSDDFVFTPIRNEGWAGEDGSTDMMNKLSGNVTVPYLGKKLAQIEQLVFIDNTNNADSLVPFFYLHYVIKQILRELNWTFEGDFFDDVNWKKVIMLNFQAIKWTNITYVINPGTNLPVIISTPMLSVEINPALHMPNISVAELFISLRNFAALAIDFNATKQIVTINFLRDFQTNAEIIDITPFVKARHQIEFVPEEKLFAISTEIDSNDSGNIQITLEGKQLQPSIASVYLLPSADASKLDHVTYCRKENAFFTVVYNETTRLYEWIQAGDNIFSYEPANFTDQIETKASTVTSYLTEPPNGTPQFSLIPYVKQEGNYYSKVGNYKHWGIRLLFFHGLKIHGYGADETYIPFASANNIYGGTTLTPFNLSFVNGSIYDANDHGLYRTHFYEWFKLIASAERYTISARMDLLTFNKINFNSFLIIHNIPFIIETIKETKPFNGDVQFILRKVNFKYTEEVIAPVISCAPPAGLRVTRSSTSVVVNFDAVGGENNYELLLFNTLTSVVIPVTSNQLPYTISNLIQDDPYTIQVRTNCNSGADSDYSQPVFFTLFPLKEVNILNAFTNTLYLQIKYNNTDLLSVALDGATYTTYQVPIPAAAAIIKIIAFRFLGPLSTTNTNLIISGSPVTRDTIEQYASNHTAVTYNYPNTSNGFDVHMQP